jgi:hypothetical protein
MFLIGVGLHIGMEASGLQIGKFSYVMIGLYLLYLPNALLCCLAYMIDIGQLF